MNIKEEYFEWMYQIVDGKGYSELLNLLNDEDFYAIIPLDDNRLIDGCELRYRFADECSIPKVVIDRLFESHRCSVLEMMVGLAIRIEDTIMADADFGDRSSMWFWIMIKSLGLYDMTNDVLYNSDTAYDEIKDIIHKFLEREYKPNGEGGLFTVYNTTKDLRNMEIWYQMCMFFNNLL